MSGIGLGDSVRDPISGFTGIVTAQVVYVTGAPQSCVQPPIAQDGAFRDGKYFDTERLELTGAARIGFSGPDGDASRCEQAGKGTP